jgi:hypothetical protein
MWNDDHENESENTPEPSSAGFRSQAACAVSLKVYIEITNKPKSPRRPFQDPMTIPNPIPRLVGDLGQILGRSALHRYT